MKLILICLLFLLNNQTILSQSKMFIEHKDKTIDSLLIHNIDRVYFTIDTTNLYFNGYTYHTVIIGNQEWTVENLRSNKYNDGTPINNITYGTDWTTLTTGAYCAYENDSDFVSKYGYLYNFYAVETGKLAPTTGGWRVPTNEDWANLAEFLNPHPVNKLKSTNGWYENGNGANYYGFSALPSGFREPYMNGDFYELGRYASWWSSSLYDIGHSWHYCMYYYSDNLTSDYADKRYGYSVRLVRDL